MFQSPLHNIYIYIYIYINTFYYLFGFSAEFIICNCITYFLFHYCKHYTPILFSLVDFLK